MTWVATESTNNELETAAGSTPSVGLANAESAEAAANESPVGDASPANGVKSPADDEQADGEGIQTAQADEGHADEGHADDGHADDGHAGDTHGDGDHHDGDHHEDGQHEDGHHGEITPMYYLSQEYLVEHVQDSTHFEYSGRLFGMPGSQYLDIPQPLVLEEPVFGRKGSTLEPFDLKITKFMVIEVLVAVVLVAIFVPLAQRIKSGSAPRGRFWNLFEAMLMFVRNEIARPSIGKHEADKFLPFLWSIFFFVLGCNLFGLIPFMGSPTGAFAVTTVLALATFAVVLGTGIQKMGFLGFFKAQVPHMDLPAALAVVIVPMIFVIEVLGLFMKHFVLALRLFANMFAGHIVLAALIGMIGAVWGGLLVWFVAPASVGASVAVNLLELFVAFLQAYVFTFLSALFIGAAAHPH